MKPTRPQSERSLVPWLAFVLAATFVVYLPSLKNGFTNWDDPFYVMRNPFLRQPSFWAVLTTPVASNWHPLTIWSYALNYRLSGLDPVSYHWMNLLLHLANTALVFAFVRGLAPKRRWTMVATSLFFGIHPMHVESVAWIAERKDVLYAFFYLIGLLAYLRYLKSHRWAWLAATFAAFVLSAASKSAAIVFPLTLLALDYYRRRPFDARSVAEKVPFLAVSVAVLFMTFRAQIGTGAIDPGDAGPIFARLLVACFGVMMYVAKLFVPVGLSAVYPYPKNPATSLGPEFYLALVLVGVMLPAVLYYFRRNRPMLFGIAFFFINIFLVLQFVTVGHALMADRYTYLPYVGLFFALAWWLDENPPSRSAARATKVVLAGILVLLVPLSLVQTWTRCQVWRDSDTLWTDVIRQYPGQVFDAYIDRGQHYQELGRDREALADFEQASRLDPNSPNVALQRGMVLARNDRPDSALASFDRAIRLEPGLADAWNNRGAVRLQKGDVAGALSDISEAIRLNPRLRGAYANRGIAYNLAGDLERSIADYRTAIELEPENSNTYQLWGAIGGSLETLKRPREAVDALDRAVRLAPPEAPQRGSYLLYRSRAWLSLGDRERAARDAAEAERLGVPIDADFKKRLGN